MSGPATGDRSDAAVWGALGVVYVVWGSTYLGIAILVETLPPLLGMASRFGASALLLAIGMLLVRGPASLLVTRRELGGVAVVGTLLLLGGNGLVALAERYVPSGVAALAIGSTPVWVVVLRAATGDRPTRATLAGVALGLAGVTALVVTTSAASGSRGFGYLELAPPLIALWTAVVVIGAFSWACGSFLGARFARSGRLPADPLTMTLWELICGSAALGVAGILHREHFPALAEWGARSIAAWSYLVVAGLLAFLAFTWLVAVARLSLVATYAFVNPVVAVALGWWLKDEPVSLALLACAAVVVAGVMLVVRGESTLQPASVDG